MSGENWDDKELLEMLLRQNPELKGQVEQGVERLPAALTNKVLIDIAVGALVVANIALGIIRQKELATPEQIDEMTKLVKDDISRIYSIGIE